MKSSKCRKVKVNITTYKDIAPEHNMNEDKKRKTNKNKFVCSICLNSKQDKNNDTNKRTSKSCPICKLCCDICIENAHNSNKSNIVTEKVVGDHKNTESKSVQTVQTDLNKNMNLLNEVLTVFQSKKTEQVKSKTVVLKDASVSTNDVRTKANLSFSKVYQFSIDQNRTNEDGKFVVMSSKIDQRSNLDLIRNKSSSIPQMKLEQLKYSLKEKTKSKDVVEEVNRMFATVKRTYENDDLNNLNRPSLRSGPRILPVVVEATMDNARSLKENIKTMKNSCKCCQTNMSSGDSIKCCHANESKMECCHKIEKNDKAQCCHKRENRCDKCVYMMCCHYKHSRKMEAGVMICQKCTDDKEPWIRPNHTFEDSG